MGKGKEQTPALTALRCCLGPHPLSTREQTSPCMFSEEPNRTHPDNTSCGLGQDGGKAVGSTVGPGVSAADLREGELQAA